MASAKDTFEAGMFLAGMFACGTWRGIGVAAGAPTVPGIEWTAGAERLHWTGTGNRLHYRAGRDRLHWEQGEE